MSEPTEFTAESRDALVDAVTALVPGLLRSLDALRFAGRHLRPPELPELAAHLEALHAPLAADLAEFQAMEWPESLAAFRGAVAGSAERALDGLAGFAKAPEQTNPVMAAYRALGQHWRALERLYPVAGMLPPVGRFFLNEAGRGDPGLGARLAAADHQRADAGVMHASNETDQRGGFSLYVPEYQSADTPLPLVVALHGGSGHGRGFLWSWLADARARGCIVLAPTSREGTWSLMGPDIDTPNLEAMVDYVAERWPIDRSRVLLTGMSDGGTFSWVAGLVEASPFTHLAPIAGTFHPMLLEAAGVGRLNGLPVYLVHGALDWMFPVDVARMARDAATAAGAAVSYREIADLSHTYPHEENARILDWLMQPREVP
jgi:phospholipase/carboxylesterase